MPTSAEDPELARKTREQWSPPEEADWYGLLLGLGAALGAIGACVAITRWMLT